jgi:hypothetical protein
MDFYRASISPSWEQLWKALYVEDGIKGPHAEKPLSPYKDFARREL